MLQILRCNNDRDMIARVTDDGQFWQAGSASGPVQGFATPRPCAPGATLTLSYNYAADEYGSWPVAVVRVNRKSVTVRDGAGHVERVEI
jgi:hypothetical protein